MQIEIHSSMLALHCPEVDSPECNIKINISITRKVVLELGRKPEISTMPEKLFFFLILYQNCPIITIPIQFILN